MLSYLHGYHAGNHADVLKHIVLTAVLARLTLKDKPLRFIDTHAGAGGYDLSSAAARRNREHEHGVGKLWGVHGAPAPVARWLELVQRYNAESSLARYPGSPWLAGQCLRSHDRMFLFERHPAEHRALKRSFSKDRRVKVLREDGLTGCIGLVPPPERRALLLIDPSYELRDEHAQVIDAIMKTQQRFATCVMTVWYPVIERRWVERYERALRATGIGPLAIYELTVAPESASGGLVGSGMFVINAPWQLDRELRAALPWLAKRLGRDGKGAFRALC